MPLLSLILGCNEGQICFVAPTAMNEKPWISSDALLDWTQIEESSVKSQKMDKSVCVAKSPP